MAFPNDVLQDILEGKEYLSNLNNGTISDRKKGCIDCGCSDVEKCLSRLLFSLDADAAKGDFTESAQNNYLNMMTLIGGIPYYPTLMKIYHGTASSGSTLTIEQILAGVVQDYNFGEQILIAFNNPDYLFNWFAIPVSQDVVNHYQNVNNEFDQGDIGSPSDLFNAPIVVSGYNLYMGNYVVPIIDTLLLETL